MTTIINYSPKSLYSKDLHAILVKRSEEQQFLGGFCTSHDGIEYSVTESEREAVVGQSINTDESDPLSLAGTVYDHRKMCRIWTVRKSSAQAFKDGKIEDYSSFLDMLDGRQIRRWAGYKIDHGKSVAARRAFLEQM